MTARTTATRKTVLHSFSSVHSLAPHSAKLLQFSQFWLKQNKSTSIIFWSADQAAASANAGGLLLPPVHKDYCLSSLTCPASERDFESCGGAASASRMAAKSAKPGIASQVDAVSPLSELIWCAGITGSSVRWLRQDFIYDAWVCANIYPSL